MLLCLSTKSPLEGVFGPFHYHNEIWIAFNYTKPINLLQQSQSMIFVMNVMQGGDVLMSWYGNREEISYNVGYIQYTNSTFQRQLKSLKKFTLITNKDK